LKCQRDYEPMQKCRRLIKDQSLHDEYLNERLPNPTDVSCNAKQRIYPHPSRIFSSTTHTIADGKITRMPTNKDIYPLFDAIQTTSTPSGGSLATNSDVRRRHRRRNNNGHRDGNRNIIQASSWATVNNHPISSNNRLEDCNIELNNSAEKIAYNKEDAFVAESNSVDVECVEGDLNWSIPLRKKGNDIQQGSSSYKDGRKTIGEWNICRSVPRFLGSTAAKWTRVSHSLKRRNHQRRLFQSKLAAGSNGEHCHRQSSTRGLDFESVFWDDYDQV
jgi:hypothetical protein